VRIVDGDGPPLCVVDDYAYRGATLRLQPGEALCIVTDGVPEARDAAGTMFGSARLDALLGGLADGARSAREVVDVVCQGVAAFAAGTEAYDDVTVLVVRWRGSDGRA
jgi:serine phosphatase RsbU (regulator of sigma subunit)